MGDGSFLERLDCGGCLSGFVKNGGGVEND